MGKKQAVLKAWDRPVLISRYSVPRARHSVARRTHSALPQAPDSESYLSPKYGSLPMHSRGKQAVAKGRGARLLGHH